MTFVIIHKILAELWPFLNLVFLVVLILVSGLYPFKGCIDFIESLQKDISMYNTMDYLQDYHGPRLFFRQASGCLTSRLFFQDVYGFERTKRRHVALETILEEQAHLAYSENQTQNETTDVLLCLWSSDPS